MVYSAYPVASFSAMVLDVATYLKLAHGRNLVKIQRELARRHASSSVKRWGTATWVVRVHACMGGVATWVVAVLMLAENRILYSSLKKTGL